MSDLISRKEMIRAVDSLGEDYMSYYKLLMQICRLPSAEPEQKTFHVIDKTTGKEADPYEIALNEDWAKSLCYCDMVGFAILEDGTLILADECGRFEFIQENDRFEIVWDEVTDED